MDLLVFDFGGTTVKYSVWQGSALVEPVASFPTPKTWEAAKATLLELKHSLAQRYQLAGAAFSFPGVIDQANGQIVGLSAIEYIHNFPIKAELEALLGLPVAFENDANCAALAEVWTGVAKGLEDVLFVVPGTGIGGAVVLGGKIRHGAHLYGGEWGHIYLGGTDTDPGHNWSAMATAVHMAERYCRAKELPDTAYSGREVFALAEQGDVIAQKEVATFYHYLSVGIFNLQVSLDPQAVVIGGAVSANPAVIERLANEINALMAHNHLNFHIDLRPCQYGNDANLIGAVKNYLDRMAIKEA